MVPKWRRHFRYGRFATHNAFLVEGTRLGLETATTGFHNVLPLAWPRCNLHGIILKIVFGAAMHTDEYEISIGREMTLCRNFIKRLENAISNREKQYGMKTEAILRSLEQNRPEDRNPDFLAWRDDHLELQVWQQRLKDYQDALKMVKQT
jgi:hypothetical protein